MIHIAVLLKPYLELILAGHKRVECRLTRQARNPFGRIEIGQRIYFKQSTGPYGATAIAEHIIFEDNLTPKRVKQIRRDNNDLICGDAAFWNSKRHSSFATLIWLTDIQPIASGPAIRPLQGVAWLTLEEEPAWRRVERGQIDQQLELSRQLELPRGTKPQAAARPAFSIKVSPGNLRHNSLYITKVAECFPNWTCGGKNRANAAPPVTLILHEGPTVQTDIVGPRNMLRTRIWGSWFRRHGVKQGDRVVFTPVNQATYFVGLARDR